MDFLLHPEAIIETFGYAGVFAIIFAESGLFFGFFLPGDSLLLTAGLLASKGYLNIGILVVGVVIAAVIGDNVGYWFGNKAGPLIFKRENSRFFKQRNLLKAKEFYDRHGPITLVLARFMPFIRTFVPIVAGAVSMDYRTFFTFNLIGACLWGVGVTMAGYLLGSIVPPELLDKYFTYIVLLVIFVSALPTLIHLWRDNRENLLQRIRGAAPESKPEP